MERVCILRDTFTQSTQKYRVKTFILAVGSTFHLIPKDKKLLTSDTIFELPKSLGSISSGVIVLQLAQAMHCCKSYYLCT